MFIESVRENWKMWNILLKIEKKEKINILLKIEKKVERYKNALIGSTLYNNPPHLSTFRNPPLKIDVCRNYDFVTK